MAKRARRVLSLWGPVILWMALIWHLSSTPNLRFLSSWWDYPVRKLGHMGVFGILARLIARALTGGTFWPWKKIFAVSLILTCLYAGSDEWHQHVVPGRHASGADVVIDTFGAWVALGVVP